jgi:hypothetical protein
MSVTFSVQGVRSNLETGEGYVNLANANARELLQWLDLDDDPSLLGECKASELRARCMRRLWDVKRNHDPARDGSYSQEPGHAAFIVGGRAPDYLRGKCAALLALIKDVPDETLITWG